MTDDRLNRDSAPNDFEEALLADDYGPLERALGDLAESDLAQTARGAPAPPAAIFAEAWQVCALGALNEGLGEDWEEAFAPAERAELEYELPAAGPGPLIRFLHQDGASPVLVLILPVAGFARWPMIARWTGAVRPARHRMSRCGWRRSIRVAACWGGCVRCSGSPRARSGCCAGWRRPEPCARRRSAKAWPMKPPALR